MSRSLQNCSSALEHGPRRGGGVPSRNMLPTPCTHANIKAAMSGQELPEGLEDAEDGAEVPEAVRNSDLPALLRACWEGAAFLQFCRLFAAPLKLRAFSAEQLEAALLCPDDHTMFLGELLFKLLRRDTREPYTEKDARLGGPAEEEAGRPVAPGLHCPPHAGQRLLQPGPRLKGAWQRWLGTCSRYTAAGPSQAVW